jgi:hypothetical protein
MTISVEQLAELLAGIARSQQAIIDAMDGESAGWRNRVLLPKLNVAANLRIPEPRLLDIPSRVLLRSQTRVPMDTESIARDLRIALDSATPAAIPAVAPAAVAASAPLAAAPDVIDEVSFFDS